MKKSQLTSVVLSLLLSACTTIPEQVRTPDEQTLVSYAEVKNAPAAKQASNARWGGVIASVENQK